MSDLRSVRLSWPVGAGTVVVRCDPEGWLWEHKDRCGRIIGQQHGPFDSIADATIDARSLTRPRHAG